MYGVESVFLWAFFSYFKHEIAETKQNGNGRKETYSKVKMNNKKKVIADTKMRKCTDGIEAQSVKGV